MIADASSSQSALLPLRSLGHTTRRFAGRPYGV